MAAQTKAPAQAKSPDGKRSGIGRGLTLLTGIVCFGLLGYLLLQIVHQVVVPQPPQPLILVQDIPLPSGLPTPTQEKSLIPNVAQTTSLNPGVAIDFDVFDFQALDVATHRLFIAHTGPSPDFIAVDKKVDYNPTRDGPFDGHIIVFDTQRQIAIARINIPQVSGLVDAPDLGKVYAASDAASVGGAQSVVYAIDVHTLKATPIPLPSDLESPDALSYDPVNKRIYASDPGAPADPAKTMNVNRSNQNIAVINAVNDTFLNLINLGNLPLLPGEKVPANMIAPGNIPLFGHDVGHNVFDEGLQRLFVTSTVLPNGDDPNPFVLPPPGTGEFFEIDPMNAANPIVKEINLPATCGTPHGFNLDEAQQVGFIACTDVDSATNLFPYLIRVDLKTMTVIPTVPNTTRLQGGPDIVRLDQNSSLHLNILFVACKAGITIFDITPGNFHKLGDVILGKGTHTIAIDEGTQTVYLPIIIGGRPVLRVARYNPDGQFSF